MPQPTWLRRTPRWLWVALLVVAIELSYALMVGGGSLDWPTWTHFYDLQAAGFRAGHLYLPRLPDPRVLAEPDPWNPSLRSLWLWDASLYRGHYYSYWGPLPALVLALTGALFGVGPGLGDQVPAFALFSLELAAGALLIARMARRAFRDVPFWQVLGAVALFGFASPTPWMLARPAVYEAAIAGGAAFLLLGLVFGFDAVAAEPGSREAKRALLLAGGSWALGLACRVTIGPPAALLAGWTALLLPPRKPAKKGKTAPVAPRLDRLRALVPLAAPLAASGLLLLLYNELRFDSWLEFGTRFQHSWMRPHMAWGYVLPNLYSYLLRPVSLGCRFPFVSAMAAPQPGWFPNGFALPEGYWTTEKVAGMLLVAPWVLLALGAPALGARRELAALEPRERAFVFCAFAFPLALVNGLPMIGQFIAIMRYLGDVSGALVLSGLFTAFALRERLADSLIARRICAAVVGLLAVITIAAGVLLGLQGPSDSFARLNPLGFMRAERALSLCSGETGAGP